MAIHKKLQAKTQAVCNDVSKWLEVLQEKSGVSYAALVATSLTTLALLLRLSIAPINAGLQYITFFPAVTLAAYMAGIRAGFIATLLGIVLATYIFTPPYYSWSLAVLQKSLWSNLVFFMDGVLVSILIETMFRYRDRLKEQLIESQLAEISTKRHQMVIDTAHDGFWVVDVHGNILEANQAYAEISGYSVDELVSMHTSELEALENVEEVKTHIAKIRTQGFDTFETRHRTKSGVLVDIEVSVNHLQESQEFFAFFRDITARKLLEQHLLVAQLSLDQARDSIFRMRLDGSIEYVNDAACAHLGYSKKELLELSIPDIDPDYTLDVWKQHCIAVEQAGSIRFETRHKKKNGEIVPVEIVTSYVQAHGGPYLFASVRDISERIEFDKELRIAAIAFNSHEAIMITDNEANIIRVNKAFEEITGYSEQEVLGRNPRVLSSGKHTKSFYAEMWQTLLQTGHWEGEVWDRRKNGEVYPKHLTITATKEDGEESTLYVAIFNDITERKRAEEEIYNLAFYDALTGLPNRRLLMEHLSIALAASARSQQHGGLIFLDLDNFKILNDTLGHDYGDILLKEVASRLKYCVREVDTVARLGGDEFVVLVENISAEKDDASQYISHIAEKMRAVLATPYQLKKHQYHSSPSIGICLFFGNEESVDELIKRADIAMYQAKDSGRNRVRFFDPYLQHLVEARAATEADLRVAIQQNQFELHYQVQVDHALQPFGAEALIRWHHPARGMVSPAEFIPIAEQGSLILDIGHWVLETACQQLAYWSREEKTNRLILAVNVSASQFIQAEFIDEIEALIQKYNITPSLLKLELTESIALENLDFIISKLAILKNRIGVRLSLDDFGTGYSSLSYLKRLPLNQIKIDQGFIRDMLANSSDAVMVKTIIDLAGNFDMDVIAEGVETEEQFNFLKGFGCLAYQGYLFGKPIPIGEFNARLASGNPPKTI
jgi:diguanylate cyclase (GGDEF)-like protein/PAS domain S-box-containing protein